MNPFNALITMLNILTLFKVLFVNEQTKNPQIIGFKERTLSETHLTMITLLKTHWSIVNLKDTLYYKETF